MFQRVAVADHCDLVIVQYLKRTWLWSSERLETLPDFDPWMIECRRSVFSSQPPGLIERVHRVGVRRIVSGTR